MRSVAVVSALGFSVVAGFMVGLAMGRSTQSRIGENVSTSVSDGVLTVQVDAKRAASEGLERFFSDLWR